VKLENHTGYILLILAGAALIVFTLIKVLGFNDFSSDWLWLIAGLGLMVEGILSFLKQRQFDKKYKIVLKKSKKL